MLRLYKGQKFLSILVGNAEGTGKASQFVCRDPGDVFPGDILRFGDIYTIEFLDIFHWDPGTTQRFTTTCGRPMFITTIRY